MAPAVRAHAVTNPFLYLPVEVAARELDAKLLLPRSRSAPATK